MVVFVKYSRPEVHPVGVWVRFDDDAIVGDVNVIILFASRVRLEDNRVISIRDWISETFATNFLTSTHRRRTFHRFGYPYLAKFVHSFVMNKMVLRSNESGSRFA